MTRLSAVPVVSLRDSAHTPTAVLPKCPGIPPFHETFGRCRFGKVGRLAPSAGPEPSVLMGESLYVNPGLCIRERLHNALAPLELLGPKLVETGFPTLFEALTPPQET